MKIYTNKLICAAVFFAFGFNVMATTIYDDSANYNNQVTLQLANGLTVGNEITNSGVWALTNFSFEYTTPSAALPTSLAVDVQFFLNNGTVTNGFKSPGTLFYDSGFFFNTAAGLIPGGGAHTISYNMADLYTNAATKLTGTLPSDFTFAITFGNMGTNQIFLPLANSQNNVNGQTVRSFGDYWLYNNVNSQWTLMYSNSVAANFVVNFSGVVPEPSVMGLSALGGLLFLGASKLKRKR